jgi:predicted lactoylglutathione lyase
MTTPHTRQLYINLPVRDLARSKAFFSSLGFEFNPKLAGDHNDCMLVAEGAFVMLSVEAFFKTFTRQSICDTSTHSEALFSVSCESREAVDEMVKRAIAGGGGSDEAAPQDHGFMYDWSFFDPDGHRWGVFWMNPAATQ